MLIIKKIRSLGFFSPSTNLLSLSLQKQPVKKPNKPYGEYIDSLQPFEMILY